MNFSSGFPVTIARLKLFCISLAIVSLSGLLGGCGKNSSGNEDGQIRVINLTAESGSLDIVVDDSTTKWQTAIAPGATTAFANIGSGSRRLRISNAGGVIVDGSVNAISKQKQLLVVTGGASSVGMVLLNNDIASGASGKTKIRVSNYAVGLGVYDIYATTATEDFLSVEPKVRSVSTSTFELDAGTYTIRLTSPNTKDVLFAMSPRALEGQKYYNMGLYNLGSGELPNAFWLVQNDDTVPEILPATVSRVRTINAQSGVPTVNVNVGGNRIFTNVPFGGVSNFARTTSGSNTITFVDTSNPAQTYTLTDTFIGARDYSVFLAANLSGAAPSAFRIVDTILPPSAGKARVRLVNASTVVDLSLALSFTAITPTVASRAASNYFEVVAGVGTPVTITQGAAASPVISLAGTDLTTGKTYSIIVSGAPGALQITSRQDN